MAERARVTITLAVFCLFLVGAAGPVAGTLSWEREAIVHGEVWRLWTGHLVHYSMAHAGADALALLAAGSVAEPLLGARRFGAILLAGAAAISLGLLACAPAMREYRGASGLAMLVAALAGSLTWQVRPGLRRLVACAAMALLSKVVWEACGAPAIPASLPATVTVAWQAHVLGLLAGACAATWCQGIAVGLEHGRTTHPRAP